MIEEEDLSARVQENDPLVVYLIVRFSLGMSPGKAAAQCGHAVQLLMAGFHRIEKRKLAGENLSSDELNRYEKTKEWLEGIYRKIVLRATEVEWRMIKESLDGFLIKDVGLTEVPMGAETAICLWPMRKSEVPKLIRRLQLL